MWMRIDEDLRGPERTEVGRSLNVAGDVLFVEERALVGVEFVASTTAAASQLPLGGKKRLGCCCCALTKQ
jgi:hypothetical protein